MQEGNILQKVLHEVTKYILHIIATAIILTVMIVILIQITYLHEKKELIDTCIKEGNSLEHCQSVWDEIDALN